MSEACGAVKDGAVCKKTAQHPEHIATKRVGTRLEHLRWPNEDYVAPTETGGKKPADRLNALAARVGQAAAQETPEQREQRHEALDAPHAYLSSDPAPTSAIAAQVSAVRNSARRKQVLAAVLALGGEATDDEVCVLLDDPNLHAGRVASRRGELEGSGWLEAKITPERTLATRPTRTGLPAQVWQITASGRSSLHEIDLPPVGRT